MLEIENATKTKQAEEAQKRLEGELANLWKDVINKPKASKQDEEQRLDANEDQQKEGIMKLEQEKN